MCNCHKAYLLIIFIIPPYIWLSTDVILFFVFLAPIKVKRPGEENVKCTIMFLLDYQVSMDLIRQMSVPTQALKK